MSWGRRGVQMQGGTLSLAELFAGGLPLGAKPAQCSASCRGSLALAEPLALVEAPAAPRPSLRLLELLALFRPLRFALHFVGRCGGLTLWSGPRGCWKEAMR